VPLIGYIPQEDALDTSTSSRAINKYFDEFIFFETHHASLSYCLRETLLRNWGTEVNYQVVADLNMLNANVVHDEHSI
jgi:hypothetical protein